MLIDPVLADKGTLISALGVNKTPRVAKPAILLADEPTGNLDSATSQDVLGLLRVTSERFHQTIVMITHNEEIAQMADRIIRIEDGKIVSGKQTLQIMDKNPNQKEGADCVEREK